MAQEFAIALVGVIFNNEDGKNRQQVIADLKIGSEVILIREYDNIHDPDAVAVVNTNDDKIGYLPAGDRLADHLDMGGETKAHVLKRTGGPGFIGRFIKSKAKKYGCVIFIKKGDYDYDKVRPYIDESRIIEDLLYETSFLEKIDADQAILNYIEVVRLIKKMDSKGLLASAWRRARHPVNRLSMLLTKRGNLEAALACITDYESQPDWLGLTKTDRESVLNRKNRLAKKLG